MTLSLISSLCLLTVFLPSQSVGRMLPFVPSIKDVSPSPTPSPSRTVIHLWNSSSLIDQSFGATWAFAINAHGAERIDIDFAVANLTSDTPCINCSALRISLRFDEGHIVLNSRRDGKWDFEERSRSPVERDEDFNLVVKLVNDGFEIIINSYWHAKYYSHLRTSQISDVRSFVGPDSHVTLRYSEEEAPEGSQDVVGQLHKSKRALNEYQTLLDQYRNSYNKLLEQFSQLQSGRNEETQSEEESENEQQEVEENQVDETEGEQANGEENGDQQTSETDYQETDDNQGHDGENQDNRHQDTYYDDNQNDNNDQQQETHGEVNQENSVDENQEYDDTNNQDQETHYDDNQNTDGQETHNEEAEEEESNNEDHQSSENEVEDETQDGETSHEDNQYEESGEEGVQETEESDTREEESLEKLEQEYREAMKRYMNAKLKQALAQMDI